MFLLFFNSTGQVQNLVIHIDEPVTVVEGCEPTRSVQLTPRLLLQLARIVKGMICVSSYIKKIKCYNDFLTEMQHNY